MGRSAGRPLSLKAIESVAIYDGCCPPNSEVAAGARGSQIRQLHRKRIAEGSLGGADCGEPAECGGRASPGAPSPIEAIDVIVVVDLGGGRAAVPDAEFGLLGLEGGSVVFAQSAVS